MHPPIEEQVNAVRKAGGVWRWEDAGFVRFTGSDAASWLQSQTTNNVLALESGQGCANALLDRKGRVQSVFTLHRWDGEYWLLTVRGQVERLLDALDAHLFIEDVTMEDASAEVDCVAIQGPRALPFLASLIDPAHGVAADALPRERYGCMPVVLAGFQTLVFQRSLTGEDGFVLVAEAGQGGALAQTLLEAAPQEFVEAGPDAREVLRIEAGVPQFLTDFDHSYRLPETTLEREAVDYDKGCYLGQEVVARMRAYGALKQALMGLEYEGSPEDLPPAGAQLNIEGARAGRITSRVWSPTVGRTLALAFLGREHRVPGDRYTFESDGWAFTATVRVLPFVEGVRREDRAQSLYDDALARFERDAHDEDDTAIELLKEALALHPAFEDAYEVLGVVLNRHGRVDEAIHFMTILAELNPNCVMAHTNLSVFYMTKGMIKEAEDEKAHAAVLQMKEAQDAQKAEEMAAAERRRIEAEARERIGMFEEVLEIDPGDSLATFGMGSAYIQLQEYERAIPFLEKATQAEKDYSAAFLNLGKCYEFLGRHDEARRAYRSGIEAATRKGDLMPMREMERRLKQLGAEDPVQQP